MYLQTCNPEHPLLQTLLRKGYSGFTDEALSEREKTRWPPYSHLALLRVECASREPLFAFLRQARDSGTTIASAAISLLGPATAPMERRAGRYRGQLLVQSQQRQALQTFLSNWQPQLQSLPGSRKVRWSLDVDPVELF